MQKAVFAVLHYKTTDITIRCVDSILKSYNSNIYVYDNGSIDGSGELLEKYYFQNNRVNIVISHKNEGFSIGHNKLFEYIEKQDEKFDFYIACNNDLIFSDVNFLSKLYIDYESNNAAVVGPDIRVYDDLNVHQNPLMLRARTEDEIREYIFNIEKN